MAQMAIIFTLASWQSSPNIALPPSIRIFMPFHYFSCSVTLGLSVCLTSAGESGRRNEAEAVHGSAAQLYRPILSLFSIDGKLAHSNGTIFGEFLLVIILVNPGAMDVNV
jgi:hypothetical protein